MATIIKSTSAAKSSPTIAYQLHDVSEQAQRCLDEARTQAEAIVNDANREAEHIRQMAQEDGLAAATRLAEAAVDEKIGQQIQTLLPALSGVIAKLSDARQAWLRHWERNTVGLAVRIAGRAIRRELARDPEITLGLIQEALELAAGSPHLKIMLNPDDFHSLGAQAKMLAGQLAAVAKTEIVPHESITIGGCRVETAYGVIDEQIETRLQRIASELIDDNP
jgi:flagellar assembly protein FliH